MPAAADPIRAEARRILALAWPVILSSLNWTLLQLTDVVVLGWVGEEAVAAFSASRAILFVTLVGGVAGLSGILVAASRADGARDLAATGAALREGLALALVAGGIVGVVLIAVARPALTGIGVAAPLVPDAAAVVRVMGAAYPCQLVIIAVSYFLEGVSRPRRVLIVNLATLPVNAVLAWAWSGGHLGLPAWGATGAAAATLVASILGAIGIVAAALTLPDRTARDLRLSLAGSLPGALALGRFGIVPAIAAGLELAGFSILIALSTTLGNAAAHAFSMVFSIHNLTFSVALGIGSAAGVRVGNAVGEGRRDAARPRAVIAAVLSLAATGLLGLLLWCTGPTLFALFPASPEARATAVDMLARWAPFIAFDGMQIVLLYALRSLGDQVAAGVNAILAYFVVTGGVGWWLVGASVGPVALAWASGAGMVAAALLHGLRFWWVSSPRRNSARAS